MTVLARTFWRSCLFFSYLRRDLPLEPRARVQREARRSDSRRSCSSLSRTTVRARFRNCWSMLSKRANRLVE